MDNEKMKIAVYTFIWLFVFTGVLGYVPLEVSLIGAIVGICLLWRVAG